MAQIHAPKYDLAISLQNAKEAKTSCLLSVTSMQQQRMFNR